MKSSPNHHGAARIASRKPSFRTLALTFLSALLLAAPAFAGTQVVTVTTDSGAGSLRNAVTAAASGDTIDLTGVSGTITLTTGEIVVNKSLTFSGPGAGTLTISGNNASRVFRVDSGLVVFKDLTVANGRLTGGNGAGSSGGGGGGGGGALGAGMIVDNGAVVTIQNVTFSGNVVQGGNGGGSGSGNNGAAGGAGSGAASAPPASAGKGICGSSGGAAGGGTAGGGGGSGGSCGATEQGGTGAYGGGGGGGGNGGTGMGGLGGVSLGFGGTGATGTSYPTGGGGGGGAGLGAGLFVWANGTVKLSNVSFQNNTATGGAGGTISGRTGSSGQGKGAAVFLHPCANVQAENLTFTSNTSGNAGSSTFAIDGTLKDNAHVYGTFNPVVVSATTTFYAMADVSFGEGYGSGAANGNPVAGQLVHSVAHYNEVDYGDGYIEPAYTQLLALKFNLKALSGPVSQAKLRIRVAGGAASSLNVLGSTDDAWTEVANTFPATYNVSVKTNVTGITTGVWLEVDVSSFIAAQAAGDGIATLVLAGPVTGDYNVYFNASEDCPMRPQLVLSAGAPNIAPTFVGSTTNLNLNQDASAADLKALLHVSDASTNSQTLTWSQSGAPAHGTLSFVNATNTSGGTDITPGGTITYTPTAGYSGSDSFTVQVSDGTDSATRTIAVTIADTAGPTVAIGSPSASLTAGGPVSFTITYTDLHFSASTLTAGNITVNSTGTASASGVSVTGSGNTRTVTLTGITGNGTLGLSIAAGTATDVAANSASAAGPSTTFTVDNTAPTLSLGSPSAALTRTGPVTYTVTYADANFNSSTLTAGNITVNSTGTASASGVSVTGSGTTRTVSLTGLTGTGTLGLSIAAGTATDTAGNGAPASGASATFNVDNTRPTVASVVRKTPVGQSVHTNQVIYTVGFSEPVSGVNANSFQVSPVGSNITGTIGTISGGPQNYDVTVNVTSGTGEFRLVVRDTAL